MSKIGLAVLFLCPMTASNYANFYQLRTHQVECELLSNSAATLIRTNWIGDSHRQFILRPCFVGDLRGEATFYLHSSVTRQLNLGQSVSQAVSRPFCRNGKEHWARSVNLIGPQVRLYYGPSAGKCLQHIAAGNVIRSCDSEEVLMMIMTPFKEQQPR